MTSSTQYDSYMSDASIQNNSMVCDTASPEVYLRRKCLPTTALPVVPLSHPPA